MRAIFNFQFSNFKLRVKYVLLGILAVVVLASYILHPTSYIPPVLADSISCPLQITYPRVVTGLISTKTINNKFSNPTGTCVVDTERAAFLPFRVPTYDSLKAQFYDKSQAASKNPLSGNQIQGSLTSPINLSSLASNTQFGSWLAYQWQSFIDRIKGVNTNN